MQLINNSRVLGQSLREARKKRKMTQAEAAGRAGILAKTVSLMENHPEKCSIATLLKYLSVLDRELFLAEREEALSSDGVDW